MSILTVKASSRRYVMDYEDDGEIVEFGPAGTNNQVGVMTLQFKGSLGAVWSAVLLGRVFGVASDEADMPFVPIPYRLISLNNVAQDYGMVSTILSGDAIIQVPANGLSVAMLVGWTSGTVVVCSWDMNGSGAV